MAVNKKGGDVNSLEGSDDFGLADLGRLEQQYTNEPIAIRELRRRASRAKEERGMMNALADNSPAVRNLPEFKEAEKVNSKTTADLENRLRLNKIASRERSNQQAVNIIGREYSERAINSYVTANSNSLENQVAGASMASQGYASLASTRENIMNQMKSLRDESMEAAGSYMGNRGVNSGSANTLQFNSYLMKDLAQKLIPVSAAMSQLKTQGLDPQSQQRALINTGDKAAGLLAYNKLEDEMKSGKGLGSFSAGDLRKKEAEAAEKLIKALEDLRNAAGKSSEELESLNKNAQDAAKEFEDMSEARKIGPPGGGGYRTGAVYASAVAQLANLVGNTIQTMAIDQPMAQMANIGGYANIENQKYDSWRAGNEGNMTERLNAAGYANAGEFGRQMANRAGWVVGSRIVGGAATAVAGGLQLADAVTSTGQNTVWSKTGIKDANSVQQLANGGMALGEGIANTAIYGKDAIQKISTSQAEIAGNLQAMNATRALTHIPGYQLQQYRDYLMHLNKGAQGMGSNAGNFIDQAGGSAFIDRMSGVGLGSGEMGGLAAFGSANMGSMFTADMAIRAKHYENQGWGSSQENMQRMAGFAAAGSQNPMQSMEKMMERAVGSGINSSKALNIIAENTGQLVEADNMRGSGFDTSDAITRAILGATDKNNTNREFAVRQASETYRSEADFKTNSSTSFAGMVAISRIQKDLGLDFNSALSLQTTSPAMRATWAKMVSEGKMSAVTQQMRNQGIDASTSELFKSNPNEFFKKDAAGMLLTQVERGGAGWATGATQDFAKLQQWAAQNPKNAAIFSGDDPEGEANAPDWVKKALMNLNQSFRNTNKNANPLAIRRDMGTQMGFRSAASAGLPQEGTMRQDAFGLTQEERSLGERQRNEAMKQGMRALGAGGAGGTTGALAVAATGRTNQGLAGSDAEAKWAEAAAKSAADFGASAMRLDSASGKLVEAAGKLIEFAGASKMNKIDDDVKKEIKKLEDKLPKIDPQSIRLGGGLGG